MMQPDFYQLSPLFAELPKLPLSNHWPTLAELNQFYQHTHPNSNLRFVPQAARSDSFAEQYEPRIYLKHEVQTRDQNWHDFFNFLVWLRFPLSKRAMNAKHYQEQQLRAGKSKQRSPLENTLALFDENGVIVICDQPDLLELLRNHQWHALFWLQRQRVMAHMRFIIIGHSLYEKALQPYIGMTGSGLIIDTVPTDIDQHVSELITSGKLHSTKQLNPVPILGIPGWSPLAEQESFYDNQTYFRPKPSGKNPVLSL